jgi:hypothetical protein
VIQGELMRAVAIASEALGMQLGPLRAQYADQRSNSLPPLILDAIEPNTLIAGAQDYPPMQADFAYTVAARLSSTFDGTLIRANGAVATPCGMLWPANFGASGILLNNFLQATALWKLQGITYDSAGSPLPNCDVIAFETGRLTVGSAPVEGRTISDGSGNYSIPVALNTHYEVTAYLAGSPDVAGITIRSLTPVPA